MLLIFRGRHQRRHTFVFLLGSSRASIIQIAKSVVKIITLALVSADGDNPKSQSRSKIITSSASTYYNNLHQERGKVVAAEQDNNVNQITGKLTIETENRAHLERTEVDRAKMFQ